MRGSDTRTALSLGVPKNTNGDKGSPFYMRLCLYNAPQDVLDGQQDLPFQEELQHNLKNPAEAAIHSSLSITGFICSLVARH